MKIVKLNHQNMTDINKANQPFEIIGKIRPTFIDGKWTYTEELYDRPYMKSFLNDPCDFNAYIDNPNKAVFLAYSDVECVGQIVIKKDWNQYAFIEDICVAGSARGQGIGSALMQTAVEWAKESGLKGMALETQDNNLLACRFYKKCGFTIGAVNTMIYKNFESPQSDEIAVFWYLQLLNL